MALPPGVADARRLITIVGAALAAVALVGAIAFSLQPVGNGCGSGWAAFRKPLPSPLLSPEEVEVLKREKKNLYEAATEKGRPTRECRRAGARRLITAGLGSGLILAPVGGVLGFLYWPRREELVVELDQHPVGLPPNDREPVSRKDWAGR